MCAYVILHDIVCWDLILILYFSCRIPLPHPNMARLVTSSPLQTLNGELCNSHGKQYVLHMHFCVHLAHVHNLVYAYVQPDRVWFDDIMVLSFFPFYSFSYLGDIPPQVVAEILHQLRRLVKYCLTVIAQSQNYCTIQ